MKDMMLFGNFKSGPARPLLDKLGLHEIVEMASTWDDFRKSVQAYNNGNNGVFVQRVCQMSKEIVLLQDLVLLAAILFATGFPGYAMSIDDGSWIALSVSSGHQRDAVAACIAAGCGR